jgi:hypothetical protein
MRCEMKVTHGRWLVDSESKVLNYDNGHLTRIFTIPPGGTLTPSEALAWIAGPDRATWLPDDDLRDLTLALAELYGLSPLLPLPEIWTRAGARTAHIPPTIHLHS